MSFFTIDTLKSHNLLPGVQVRFLHTESMTVAYWIFEEGAAMPEHSHPHEQVSHVIEGIFKLTVSNTPGRMERGLAAVIKPHVPHFGTALTRCHIIDVFHPVREDYRTLT
jgi:quercetin dioxygenase-like cupin family protein